MGYREWLIVSCIRQNIVSVYKSLLQKRPMTYIFWLWDIESAYGMERVIEMERYRVNKVTPHPWETHNQFSIWLWDIEIYIYIYVCIYVYACTCI